MQLTLLSLTKAERQLLFDALSDHWSRLNRQQDNYADSTPQFSVIEDDIKTTERIVDKLKMLSGGLG